MQPFQTWPHPSRALLSLAQQKGEDYQRALGSYAIERLLYRLGQFAISGQVLPSKALHSSRLNCPTLHRPKKDLELARTRLTLCHR